MPLVADWATTAALLAVLLAEGVRRLPAGAMVLRRTLRGSWRVVHGPARQGEWRLVSIWAPFFEHLVIQAGTHADLLPACDSGQEDLPRASLPSRLTIAAFRLAGGVVLLVVAFGVPVATATFGVDGFVRSVLIAFLYSAAVALAVAVCLQRLLGSWKAALTRAAPMLSPFAAPRAAELLVQTFVSELPAPAALRALVPPDEFAKWFRAHAYDALVVPGVAMERTRSDRLRAIIASVPEHCGPGDRFCPRCAAVFLPHVEECSDCTSAVLRGHGRDAAPVDDPEQGRSEPLLSGVSPSPCSARDSSSAIYVR